MRCCLVFFWVLVFGESVSLANGDTFFLVSMGDSITSGFNTRWPYDMGNGKYSWATGDSRRMPSHLNKLRMIVPHRVEFANVAKAGSTSYELAAQLERVNFARIDYLTLLVGGNDVCDWREGYANDLAQFRENVDSFLRKVIARNARVKIVVPAIPDMHHLYQIGRNKCKRKWDLFRACSQLLHSKRTPMERLRFLDRLVTANATLAEIARVYNRNVRFVSEVFDFKFAHYHTSEIDCFHPSVAGQQALARITWTKGWYL